MYNETRKYTLYFLYRTNWKYFVDDSFFHTYVFEKIADFHREKKECVLGFYKP